MDVSFSKKDKIIIAEIDGDIDHRYADELRRFTERELYASGADSIIFNMSKVHFMDSSGIGVIIGRYKTVSALGGKLVIACPSCEVNRILEISGIYRIIKSCDSVFEAVAEINGEVLNYEE